MNAEAQNILAECFRRQPNVEPSDVAYSAGSWFGAIPEHQRQRYRRAIALLARDGMLVAISQHGRRLSHLRLTDAGAARGFELLRDKTSDTAMSAASTTATAGTSPTAHNTEGEENSCPKLPS